MRQGHESVAVIPAGVWQAARSLGDSPLGTSPLPAGDVTAIAAPVPPLQYSLVGCTVAPGFEFEDFRFVKALPEHEGHFTAGALARFADLL